MSLDTDSLERLVPESLSDDDVSGQESKRLHIERYEFAARHATPGRLLDVACGAGYGTRLLADRSPQVTEALGIDLSAATIEHARQHYGGDRVRFERGDAMSFPREQGFDTIVSLETVEHLPDPAAFLARQIENLRPGGVLVASVPTTPTVDVNPHHLHDFTERSFRSLVEPRGLSEIGAFRQVQPFRVTTLLQRAEARVRDMRPNLPGYYLQHPGALFRRVWCTLRHGLANHYLTIAWRTSA